MKPAQRNERGSSPASVMSRLDLSSRRRVIAAILVTSFFVVGCGSSATRSASTSVTAKRVVKKAPVRKVRSANLFFRYSQGPEPTLTNAASEARRYGIVILAGAYKNLAKRLHAAHPGVKVLLYKNVTQTIGASHVLSDRSRTTVVDYENARRDHPSWLLRGSNGKPLTRSYGGDETDYLVDVGNRSLQQQAYTTMLRQAKADGWDGIFLDDVLPTVRYWLPSRRPSDVVRYPTDAAWSAATRSFLAYVGPHLRAQGLLVVANTCCDLVYHQRSDWASLLSGTLDEGFLSPTVDHNAPLSTVSKDPSRDWRGYLREVVEAESAGKILLADTPGTANTPRRASYALATVLLAWNGHGSRFEYHTSDNTPYWDGQENLALRLGAPLGSYKRLRTGVYRRTFQRGIVVVDPRAAGSRQVKLSLGGRYSGAGFSNVRRIGLRGATGYVLIKKSSSGS